MAKQHQLLVSAIKNGTVIDHITRGHALKIVRLLNLPDYEKLVTIGLNLPSQTMDVKDLIKVANRELTPAEINQVAIFAPQASINIIKNYQVIKKFKAQIPKIIKYVIVCPNPKCITNHEGMDSKFHVIHHNGDIELQCFYCEKNFTKNDIKEYKNH